jgi:hypothetical protein
MDLGFRAGKTLSKSTKNTETYFSRKVPKKAHFGRRVFVLQRFNPKKKADLHQPFAICGESTG